MPIDQVKPKNKKKGHTTTETRCSLYGNKHLLGSNKKQSRKPQKAWKKLETGDFYFI